MGKLIAVVDDEADIVELVSVNLEKAGFKVEGFYNANDLLSFIKKKTPDLIILDLMLPDADGFEICKNLKSQEKYTNIPVIMLTAKGEEVDKVVGLEIGADDYVTKPFSTRELVARVKVVLRRGEKEEEPKKSIKIGEEIEIFPKEYKVLISGKKIELTSTEFRILHLLAKRKGWVFSRDQILDYLYEGDRIVFDRTIDVHITHLRDKLGKFGECIKSIRGIGYKIEE
ncbi:response regulator transcription factor [candidate division WOR-3 bacterium]|nr:response regulator transcription factor [candidate division WOR-3 bacterium]